MALSLQEEKILADIERHLARECPRLAARLSGRPYRPLVRAAAACQRRSALLIGLGLLALVSAVLAGTVGTNRHDHAMVAAAVGLLGLAAVCAGVLVLSEVITELAPSDRPAPYGTAGQRGGRGPAYP